MTPCRAPDGSGRFASWWRAWRRPDDDAWLDFESALFEPVMTAIEDDPGVPVAGARDAGQYARWSMHGARARIGDRVRADARARTPKDVEIAYSLAYPVSPGTT